MIKCTVCNRVLSDNNSIQRKMGVVCQEKNRAKIVSDLSRIADYSYKFLNSNVILITEQANPMMYKLSLDNSIEFIIRRICGELEIELFDYKFLQYKTTTSLLDAVENVDLVSIIGGVTWTPIYDSSKESEKEVLSEELIVSRLSNLKE